MCTLALALVDHGSQSGPEMVTSMGEHDILEAGLFVL